MRLYELSAEIRALEEMLDDDDVDEDSFRAALDDLETERDAKIANIGLLVQEMRTDLDTRKAAIDVLRSKNSATNRRIAWLTNYVLQHIDTPVKTPLVNVRKQRGRMGLMVDDDAQLPDRFYRKEINRTELRSAVEAGEEYHGVRLERGDDFVVIR